MEKPLLSTKNNSIEQKKKLTRIFLIVSIVFMLILTFNSFKRLLILIGFILFNFGFAFIKRKIPTLFIRKYFFGIEYILFCTVITSVAFGSKLGMIMGALLMLSNYIAEKRVSKYFFLTISLYMIIGYNAFFFRHIDIRILGVIITIFYNIFSFIGSKLIGGNVITMLLFNLVNILFNIFLFTSFGINILNLIN